MLGDRKDVRRNSIRYPAFPNIFDLKVYKQSDLLSLYIDWSLAAIPVLFSVHRATGTHVMRFFFYEGDATSRSNELRCNALNIVGAKAAFHSWRDGQPHEANPRILNCKYERRLRHAYPQRQTLKTLDK